MIKWSDNVEEYLSNALSPAKKWLKSSQTRMKKLPLPLLIISYRWRLEKRSECPPGVKLTGWKIDIKSKIDYVNQHKITTENTNDLADDILLDKEELESAEALDLIDESTADQELVYEDHSDLEFWV